MAAFNTWQPQGTAIPAVSSDQPEQPTVFYEAGAQILSPNLDGKIFKMWFTTGPVGSPVGINYAESNDGLSWTRFGSNPVVAGEWGARLFKHGATYYLYSTTGFPATGINVYTSTDGVTWDLALANALTTSVSGFDSASVGQLNVLTVLDGIWYSYYWGLESTVGLDLVFKQGLATSTDGIHWSKDAGNPVVDFNGGIFLGGSSWSGAVALGFAITPGPLYYAWGQISSLVFPGATTELPSDLMRWVSNSPRGPWIPLNTQTYSRNDIETEGVDVLGGQVADPCVIEVDGTTYLYYTATPSGDSGQGYVVNCATAAMSIADLVATFEGVQNVPISGDPSLNLDMLASDLFNRADGSLGANWTKLNNGLFVPAQIISDEATSSSAGANCDSWYNAISWPDDQWSQITIKECLASSFVGLDLRSTNDGNSYRFYWTGVLGTPGSYSIQKLFGGNFSELLPGGISFSGLIVNQGDSLLAVAQGSNLYLYLNGVLVAKAIDSDISAGSAGFLAAPLGDVSNALLDNWSGGGFKNAPPAPPPPPPQRSKEGGGLKNPFGFRFKF